MRRSRLATLPSAAAVAAGGGGFLAFSSPDAQAATTSRIPAHVFAPYFEAYNGDSLSGLAQQSGNKFLTMAFIQTASRAPAPRYWNGDTGMPIASSTSARDITAIRAGGGDVIPSFGGYAADNAGTEIADSCTDVNAIAAALREGDHHLRRDPDRPRHRGQLADRTGRHRPPQQGDQAGRGLGRGQRPDHPVHLHAADHHDRPGADRRWRCCRTRSATTPGSTSSTS